ncbi:TPA: site-specific DNA-methyltransferase [Vibrio parahaemolyticus]|nr:site-specific DNA-methyltransferase [Vibrio parahaemolyticus]HCG6308275.1 site-specific DNA-methyltransferase [Vibrio parahaemolyticus]HCH5612263.1 site-specific DNA-methyltransferase [Vibrio parahaemolyticus]HCM0779274.1 site-specific DNA-methyltransferase [Vibrio parahaemolyticus]HCM1200545.1 site-specific DNA-methyltransferase [Vibrio parahaemolyticus]
MSKYNELVKKLKEIFQIDRPELDFGIYRILNARADEINDYLDNKLKAKIQSALADAGNANKADLEQQLQAAIKAATDAGFEPDKSPKVQELKGQLTAAASGASEHENAVFSHLLTFFSRYYDNGDFISKRRYKGDTYAIPYAGEEVMLHWANKDQYYIKSGENFANYSFKLEDGRKVSFKLLAADTAKENRKDNDADRRFVLIEPHTRTKLDENGEEYEQSYQAVEVVKTTDLINGESVENEELVIHFEYKAMKKGTKQDALVQAAITTILADSEVQQHWVELTKRAPTEKNPSRTELERHLTTYTQRNTADYFIHKDLNGFLTNELDFYIKNEVMNLDNVQNAEVFADIEKQLRMIQCLRMCACELIQFLSQLENFQKKLWMKKKFVVSADYSVSLDKLDERLFSEIALVDEQWEQWVKLGFVKANVNRTVEYMKANQGLIVDTSLLPSSLKSGIINQFDNIDQLVDGILVQSDNFQAIKLLQRKYNGRANVLYLDPPYNTDAGPILYKNGFRDSSWLALMEERLVQGKSLLSNDGIACVTIDDYELHNLAKLMEQVYEELAGTVAIRIKPSGRPIPNGFALAHEYALFARNNESIPIRRLERTAEQLARYREKDEKGPFFWEMLRKAGSNSSSIDRPTMYYPFYLNSNGKLRLPKARYDNFLEKYIDFEPLLEGEQEVWPTKDDGTPGCWYFGYEKASSYASELKAVQQDNGEYYLYYRRRPNEGVQPLSFWADAKYSATEHGTALIKKMFGTSSAFSYPKSIYAVEDCLKVAGAGEKSSFVVDYFAGSATTGHAVLNLNRKDDGKRKFLLVEQGQYFDQVTKPRVLKAAFSSQWNDGLPQNNEYQSVILKTVKLESYEDTLNNITLNKPTFATDLFTQDNEKLNNDYLVNYMLDVESEKSLLSTDNFRKPFNYEMEIAADSAGATERKAIDLVETFNFLIGLHVKSIESNVERGYVRIEGTLPTGERTLILWRDCDKIGYDKLNDYANRFDLYAKEQTFDVIYINGDHNVQTAFTVEGEDGEIVRSLKLRQIEPEFLSLMFAEEA